ncbi:MAG: FAD-dependent oxidoreductase [Pseudomonadota bacterium]
MHTDTAIIGGGVIGLTTAFELSGQGASVVLVRGKHRPASLAAAGMLAPSFESTPEGIEADLFRLGMKGLARWPSFATELEDVSGLCIDLRTSGILGAFAGKTNEALQVQRSRLAGAGVTADILSAEELREIEPCLADGSLAECGVGGLLVHGEGQVDPSCLLNALEAALERRGIVRLEPDEIVRIEINADRAAAMNSRGESVISADQIILATGARNVPDIFVRNDLSSAAAAVRAWQVPVKGEALAVELPEGGPRRVIRTGDVYLCPKVDGRLVIGATEARGLDDDTPDGEAIDRLRQKANKIAPVLRHAPEISRWAGVRPGGADHAPIIGVHSEIGKRLIFALGHYRNGILLAPATAKLLSEIVSGREPDPHSAVFAPDRVSSSGIASAAMGDEGAR